MSLPHYPEYKDSGVKWLAEIPAHWSVKRLKYLACLVTQKTDSRSNPVALENIEGWSGRYLATETEFVGDGIAFLPGDILFGKLRPYLAKAMLATTAGEAVGDFHVIRPQKDVDNKFIQYAILNRIFIDIVDGSTFGSKMPRASWEFVGSMPTPTPPIGEQVSISNFLNCETAKIDTLIAEQEHLIDLLKEKHQAVISHAVTKGLDPDVPMKDSGIHWLGEIPEHWAVMVLRRLLQEHRQGYYTESEYVESGIKLLRITDLGENGAIDFTHCPQVKNVEELKPFYLKNSDFLFARTGGAGSFGLVESLPGPVVYASYLIRFRFDEGTHPGFLKYFFLSSCFQEAVKQNIHGGVNKNIHAEDIKGQCISLPPLPEQSQIADFLDKQTAKFESLATEARNAIKLLQERRSALISAAITGKIDVRRALKKEVA